LSPLTDINSHLLYMSHVCDTAWIGYQHIP